MHGQSSVISQGHYVPSNLLVAWQPSKWFLLYWPRCKFHVQWYWHYQEMWTVCFVRVTWLWRTVCYCQCKAVALGILNCGHVYANTVRCMYACMYVWMFASVHGSQPKRTTATENISFTFTTSLLFFSLLQPITNLSILLAFIYLRHLFELLVCRLRWY